MDYTIIITQILEKGGTFALFAGVLFWLFRYYIPSTQETYQKQIQSLQESHERQIENMLTTFRESMEKLTEEVKEVKEAIRNHR